MGATIQIGRSENKDEVKGVEGEHHPALMAVAHDLMSAIAMKDANAVASALKAHHELKDMYEEKEEMFDATPKV